MLIAAIDEVVLEMVAEHDVLRLRAGHKVIASATINDRALVKLSDVARSYAQRHKLRFVDAARN